MDFLQQNIDITDLSNYKTPAKAHWYFEIENESDIDKIRDIMDWVKKENIQVLWISGGTNMLFAFEEYKWLVIKNSLTWWTYDKDTNILESYGAELIWEIAEILETDYWQDLWHRFIWLPWSVAWAVEWHLKKMRWILNIVVQYLRGKRSIFLFLLYLISVKR